MKTKISQKARGLIMLILATMISTNVWGAKDDVVYKINTATTKIGNSTTYAKYGPTDCASAQAGSTVSTARWCVTLGSAQTAGLWLGSNSGNKAKMTLGNGSLTEASGIASAIGVETTDTYYAAMICRTNLSKVYKVTLTYTTPGGTAPSEAWILYSTDNGSTWSVGKKVTSLSTSGTDFVFDNTITSAARYAFVIHCTNYCQFKVPVLTFYEGTTGGTTYTVTYNLNGGTGTTPTESAKSSGATFSLHNGTTGITPPSGKVFSQWKDQDNNYYNGGATYTMPAKNVTLTAQWVNTYTVTYNLNGGTGTTPTEGAHPSGATFTLHDGTTGITAPTKKEFSKWRDQDGTDYNGGVTYTMPAKAVTLTAQWVAAGGDYVLVEDAEDIGPGKYLIVYNNAKALNTHNGNVNANTYATYTDISSYYSNKKIAANATTNALAYTVAETANGYSISHIESGTTYYLGNSSNSTGAYLRWDNPFTASTDEWTLGVNSIVSARNSNYAIRWNNNSSSYRFAIYNPTGQQAVQLFKQVEACEEAELAYSPATETKTYGDAAFTKTLTNSHSVAVTYALSDVSPAGCVSINTSTGQVTINGAGSATVTASSAKQTVSEVNYCADEVSYTLTVNKANISPTLTYSPNSVTVGENSATPTVGGNTGSGTVTYAITSATPAGCATINTSTGVVTGVAVGSITVTATVAATANYNGNTATATVTINAASNFPNNRTIFIQAHSTSAWTGGGCVKAWFHSYGGSETAQTTYWLFDAGSPDEGKKLFAAIVPSTGNLPYLDIQRFAANCSDWWNKNGGCSYSDADGSNAIRSTGKHDGSSDGDYVRWNDDAVTLSLYGDPNSWGSSLASFSDQGNGVWTATYNNYAPANAAGESQEFKICTNYNGWIGNTGSNNNVTVDGMHVGSTYNIGASLDIKTHTLTLTKTFVKGTVHFDMQGHGSAISDLTNVTAGSKISAPSAPSATGYDFGGWYKEAGCSNAWDIANDVVNETMTLYAKWTKHNYTISSTLNHCSSSPSIPSSYEYTGSAAGLTYTISADAGYRLPTSITVTGTTYTWNSATGALTLTGTITSNVSITITAVQTHTVTWLSNGSNFVSPVTYDHGATLAFPAEEPTAPSSCSEKVFVGWTSDSEITSETSTEPTLITEGGAVNDNATYRAVFADEEGGGTVTVLSEPFTGFDNNATPSSPGGSATTLDGSNITYTCTAGGSGAGNTCIQTSGGPDNGNNILIRKKSGAFTVNSIPTNSQATATLTYKWRGSGTMSLSGSSNISLGSISTVTDASSNNTCTVTITINSGTTYSLTWTNSSNDDNLRFDVPTITCGGTSYDNYITQCCSLQPVTGLNVSSMTNNSVTLSWTLPAVMTGITKFQIVDVDNSNNVVVDNISTSATSATKSSLTQCNTYHYAVVSYGSTCTTISDAVTAQPFSGAKTATFNYNGGTGSPASFTTSCSGNTVTLPTPDTRTGYTFDGWWSGQYGGNSIGAAGASYTVTGNTTIWAHWSETNYTVTMAQSPAAGAELTGGTTTAHYGNTINISTNVPSGYRFTGWTSSPSVTFADASATSTSFTMPNSNVTVTANFVQIHTLTFTIPSGGGSATTPPATADHGGTVTLPAVTGISSEYSCETFLGWTTTAPNGSGTWVSTPTYKAAGATSDAINSNTTFYAVYSRSGAGASGTVTLDAAAITAVGTAGGHAYADAEWSITAADLSSWAARAYVGNKGTYLQIKEDAAVYIKLPTVGGNYRSISLNHNSNSSSRTIVYRTATGGSNVASYTTAAYATSSTIDIASGTTAGYIMMTGSYTYQITSITASYGPPPVISHALECGCLIDQFDLTYDANTANFPGSTTSCSGVDDYVFASHENKYTICSTEPTLSGYKFTGWTTNANGSGDHYDAGQEISCVPSADVTLYAQYERVYTVTFNNQGATTPVTQASAGATIAVPSATTPCNDPADPDTYTWTFVGWSATAITPGTLVQPAIEITNGTSSYTPTDDITLYAIYKKTTSTSDAFVAGGSGAYKIKATSGLTDYYAAAFNSTKLNQTTTPGDAVTYYITYNSAGTNYTIQRADGQYIAYKGNTPSGANTDLKLSADPFYWNIASAGGGLWSIQSPTSTDANTRYLQLSVGTGFKAYTSDINPAFVPAASEYYYRTMSCADEFDIIFHDNGTTINWAGGHPEASYQNLADGTTVSTFPTATYDGWTFLGWRAADYDESTTAPTASGIYSTGGNSLTIASSDVDLYPVFTRFEDNPEFDQINGGDYYIYYLASGTNDGYGAAKRVYAGTYDGQKRYSYSATCDGATTFTFTKLANGKWTIYDNTTHKYLCDKNDDWLCQQNDPAEWTITVYSGNQFDAYSTHSSYHIIAWDNGDGASSARFQNYSATSLTESSTLYHRVYLGGCTNRTFTTNPSTTPYITMNGDVAPITSSQNGAVRATSVLSVSGGNLTPSTGTITISSNNSDIYFSLSTDKNFAKATENQPKSEVTITANGSGIVTPTPVYVHYKPSSNTDTWTDVTVTASYPGAVSQTASIDLRTVKENFVIASKVGDSWYALPANMSAEGVFEPVLIEVDESNKVAYGPSTVAYKMWPVQTVNGGTDEYATNGDKVRFAGNSNAGLWASNSNNYIRDWATITAIGSTAETPAAYEWIIQTEDRNAYTLKSMYSTHYLDLYRPSSGGNAGKLVWASNSTYVTNDVHFFPLTERTIISIIPREWKSNGLVFAIDADNNISLTSGHTTAKIGTGEAASATLTRHSTGGYGLYEVALPDLTSHYGKVLTLKMKIGGVDTYAYTTIPIIVTGTTTTTTAETPFTALDAATKDYDVVILDGAKLTTNATASHACSFQNFYVYPGGTWINDNGSTSFSYLELRGGIKGIGAKDSHVQGVPHVMLNKGVTSTAGASLDMTVYTDHGYALSVPFDVDLSQVNFANSLKPGTGAQVNGTLASQFWIRKYDGAVRAANGKGGWVDITPADNKTIHAGEGYTLQGKRPKGQPFAVIRFPFSGVGSWANSSGEVAKANIPIYAHDGSATTPDNDKGWNLIANPYMATIAYNTDDELSWAASFKVGSLEKTDGDTWDGKYQWKNASNAYVTIPNDSYTAYPQTRASKATFEPFKNFFIQTDDDGVVAFDRTARSEMPRHLMAQTEQTTPIYADINLSHGGESAQAGLTIDADATTGYKFGEDYTIFENREALDYLKVYTIADGHYLVGNTLTPEETTELIPLEFYAPNTEGAYVFSLDDDSDIDRLEYMILYDAELGLSTNLLTDNYTVNLGKTGLIENRFSIGLKIRENQNTPTGTDNVNGETDRPFKFIYQDKMYILRGGVIYDATGKRVMEINK